MTDYLIMILSTDWFLPYWAEIGIHVEDQSIKKKIQEGCRLILNEILCGSKTYYHRHDSADRKQNTASEFLALLQDCDAERDVSEANEEWANLSHEKLLPSFTYWGHTLDLVQGRAEIAGATLSTSIKENVMKTWEDCQINEPGFPDICLKSESSWDNYTRTLLTGPKTLANILNSVLRERSFRSFWTHLRQRLTAEDVHDLVCWYRAMTVAKLHRDRPDLVPSYVG